MSIESSFYLSVAVLITTLSLTTYLVRRTVEYYLALRLIRWAFCLIAVAWFISVGAHLPQIQFLAYALSSLSYVLFVAYPYLRQGRAYPRQVMIALALASLAGNYYAFFVSEHFETKMHLTALIFAPIGCFVGYKLLFDSDQHLRSHTALAVSFWLASAIVAMRSLVLLFYPDMIDNFRFAFMTFWPGLNAAMVVSVIASYLEQEHLKQKQLAITDGLTQLYNRAHWEHSLQLEFARCQRSSDPVASLIMFDIDQFKRINDEFGHTAGDYVIQRVAEILWSQLRSADIAGRYGGDEFAVTLVDTNTDKAQRFAERLHATLKASPFEYNGNSMDITISAGIAGYSAELDDHSQWIQAADRALYQSKQGGRNKTSLVDSEALFREPGNNHQPAGEAPQ